MVAARSPPHRRGRRRPIAGLLQAPEVGPRVGDREAGLSSGRLVFSRRRPSRAGSERLGSGRVDYVHESIVNNSSSDDDGVLTPLKIDIIGNFIMRMNILDAKFGFSVKNHPGLWFQTQIWTFFFKIWLFGPLGPL